MTDSKSQEGAPKPGEAPLAPKSAEGAPAEGQAAASVVLNPPKAAEGPPEWLKPFSPESQKMIETSGWKSPDEILKSYTELRTKVNEKTLVEPAEGAPQAEWDAYFTARGRPVTAAEYTFAMPKDLPTDIPYNAAFADSFKAWAHETGLTKKQASALHDRYVTDMATQFKATVEANTAKVTNAYTELTTAWGAPTTEAFQRNVEMATRAMRNLDPKLVDALKEARLLAADGTVMNAPIAKALAKAGAKLYAEDGLWGGGTGKEMENPWTPGKENLTRQGEIYKADPDRARLMQKAAVGKSTL